MRIKVKTKNPEIIQEITEEEFGYVEEALSIPISEMPFSNIFGDKYRIIQSYGSLKADSPFGKTMKVLGEFGWELAPREKGDKGKIIIRKNVETRRRTKNKDGETKFTTNNNMATMGLKKYVQSAYTFFANSLPKMYNKYLDLEKLAKPAYKNLPDDPEERKKAVEDIETKFLIPRKRLMEKIDNTIAKWFNGRRHFTATSLLPPSSYEGSGNSGGIYWKKVKNDFESLLKLANDDAAMMKLQTSFDKEFLPSYIIYSRHPLDVFRMSDFVEITSCHTLPSKRHLTSLPSKWDDYNICALAEAYANGMIAYSVPANSFEEAGIEPTQEGIDEYEDGELFEDDERDVDGLKPEARVRIRNTTVTDPKSGDITRLAVPDQKVYGSAQSAFKTNVRDFISQEQKEELEKVFNDPNITIRGEMAQKLGLGQADDDKSHISLKSFQRYGGSYEDAGAAVRNNLPLMFASALGISPSDINTVGDLVYSQSMQDELESKVDKTSGLDRAQEDLKNVLEQVNNPRYEIQASISSDYGDSLYFDNLHLTLYVPLPMYMNKVVEENRREVYDFFKDYEDQFSLFFDEQDKEPKYIMVYEKDAPEVKELGYTSPVLEINYINLDEQMQDAGVLLDPHSPQEIIDIIRDDPRDGGWGANILTDPYVEDGFRQKAAALLAVSPFGDDPDYYLTKLLNSILNTNSGVGDWAPVNVEIDYSPSGTEWYENAEFESEIQMDTEWMLKEGLTPQQVGIFIVALNQSKELQMKVVELINRALDPDSGTIPMTILHSDYPTVESVVADNGDVYVEYPLGLEVNYNEINTKAKVDMLEKILTEYDMQDTITDALQSKEGMDLIRSVIQRATKSVTENKRRTKIRILRG